MFDARGRDGTSSAPPGPAAAVPGKRTLIDQLVQRQAGAAQGVTDEQVHAAAAEGTAGAGGALPFADAIQSSFGPHDISHVRAHTGGAATDAARVMGAEAFATGEHVAFAGTPDLHTAAHEAAHVVQQRAGVHLKGGVGEAGDPYEQHADAVADRVVAGQPAHDLLSGATGSATGGRGPVQRVLAADRKDLDNSPITSVGVPGADAPHDPMNPMTLTDADISALPDKPGGPQARPILERGFGANWFTVKEELLQKAPTPRAASAAKTVGNDLELRQKLVKKLQALRAWESTQILTFIRDTQLLADIPAAKEHEAKERLEWDNSGSEKLTSDVDLALKGAYNRQAVGLFNKLFRMRGWAKESGVVYDLNVYAQTFLGEEKDIKIKNDKLVAPHLKKVQADDQDKADLDQEVWSLVKMGRYMTKPGEWEAYKTAALEGLTGDALSKSQEAFRKAEERLREYHDQLTKMRTKMKIGAGDHTLATELAVSNRVYEEKLEKIIELEAELKTSEDALRMNRPDVRARLLPKLAPRIRALLLEIRNRYSESEMFSNESYITDGALNHVVMGLQKGTSADFLKSKGRADLKSAPIDLSKEEFLQSLNEQLADIC